MKHLKRTLLTLVALLAVTTGAWADEQSESFTTKGSYQLVFTGEHFTITGTQNDGSDGLDLEDENTITIQSKNNENITHVALTFNWGFRYFGKGVADPGTIEYTYANSDEGVASIKDINSTILTISSTENNGIIQISQITVYYGDPDSSATVVPLTRGTGEKANEWTFDDGMPAGNVAVSVEYFPLATAAEGAVTAATDAKATTDDALVTLDASKLTGVAKMMYFVNKSTDPAPDYDTEGWTDVLPTAESFTEAGGYNVYYYPLGTDDADPAKTFSDGDICAAPILVSLAAAPTYAVTFAEDTPEPDNWSAQPNTGVKKGETVTITYSGERKVIGVKAEKKKILVTKITLSESGSTTKTHGESGTLRVTSIEPEDADDKTYTWSSDDPYGVSIDQNGNWSVVGRSGSVTLRATANDGSGVSASLFITVRNN